MSNHNTNNNSMESLGGDIPKIHNNSSSTTMNRIHMFEELDQSFDSYSNNNNNNSVTNKKRIVKNNFKSPPGTPDSIIMDLDRDVGIGSVSGGDDFIINDPNRNTIGLDVQDSNKNDKKKKSPRNSCSIVLVFLFEILAIILLLTIVMIFKYTDLIKPVKLAPQYQDICRMPYSYNYTNLDSKNFILKDSPSSLFLDISDSTLFYLLFIFPIVFIIFFELFRLLSRQFLDHRDKEKDHLIYIKDLKLTAPILQRRLFRITGGFILGFLACYVLIEFLKLQLGQFRPYTLVLCPDFCTNSNSNCTKTDEFEEARKSFPSLTAGLCSYSGLFLIMHLMATMNYRVLRTLRLLISIIFTLIALLLTVSRITLHHNHVGDVIVGTIVGVLFALYMTMIHLNGFANKLSNTNFFSTTRQRSCSHDSDTDEETFNHGWRDQWFLKNFHIPRVQTLREEGSKSTVWHSGPQPIPPKRFDNISLSRTSSYLKTKPIINNGGHRRHSNQQTNAYINPAFDDHLLDANNNNLVERNNSQRRQMRTFR